jgi:hypothetical protein
MIMARRYHDHHRLKILLTQECARLMAEEGIKDFGVAKRKAALRLGVSDKAALPDNVQIQQALIDYQRFFHAAGHEIHLRSLRQTALEAMRFLARFRPKLVGSVLIGTAGPHTDIQLHLFADTPKDVLMFLMDHGIPLESAIRRLKANNGVYASRPVFRFTADDTCIELTVFGLLDEREAPRSPVDGRPLRRANSSEVLELLGTNLAQSSS